MTSDFILSLDLDEMNMTKFSPMYGAPIWDECVDDAAAHFNEDWRLMNCLNFVYKSEGFASREEMDALYNWHVRRYYDSKPYRRRFAKRLWQHRWSLWHLLKHIPDLVQAARYFSANKADLERLAQDFPRHPRQPVNLEHGCTGSANSQAAKPLPEAPIVLTRRAVASTAL